LFVFKEFNFELVYRSTYDYIQRQNGALWCSLW